MLDWTALQHLANKRYGAAGFVATQNQQNQGRPLPAALCCVHSGGQLRVTEINIDQLLL